MSRIYVGTSGYDHPELKGSFYPVDLPRKDFLLYYSTKFNALEINSTFYGMPTAERMVSFYERSEGRVHFSVKVTKVLTHEAGRDWQERAAEFRQAVMPLAEKNVLSAVLVQFPESFRYKAENRFYLADLLKVFDGLPVVVEFRHKDWIRESVFLGLAARNSGIVFCDVPACAGGGMGRLQTPFIGPVAYMRMHGRNENGWYALNDTDGETHRYDYEYSEAELRAFLPVIQAACGEGREVHLYFNNHPKGIGFGNALKMKELTDNLAVL